MTIRQLIALGLITLGTSGLAGCSKPQQQSPPFRVDSAAEQKPAEGQPHAGPRPKVDQMDARAGSVDALTRKTESYTNEMSPLILARSGPQPSPMPSSVQWTDPSSFNLDAVVPRSPDGSVNRATPNAPSQLAQATPAQSNAGGSVPTTDNKTDIPPNTSVAVVTPDAMSRAANPARTGPAVGSDVLAERLARRVKDYPRDVSAQLENQLLAFLKDEQTPQMSVLSTLPPEDRELVTVILDGLTNFRNALRADNNMLLSNKVRPMLEMAERLRSQADLTIPTIRLCTRVTGFGNYEPINPTRFAAGKDEQVIVYCEVANFTSNLKDREMWETRLTWDMTLYAEQGMSVWSDKTEQINDTSRNRRHDFFVRKAITLPHTLPIGRYWLKVTIVDTQSNRVAEATTQLVIAAQ